MNNLMDTYLKFTEKKIKKYMKIVFSVNYDEEIIEEFLRTYINARYYNVQNSEKPARAFYMRILDELEYKEDMLMEKCDAEAESLDEKQSRLNLIHSIKEAFGYVLFFDNVRNVENFKTIDSIKEIIERVTEDIEQNLGVKASKDTVDKLYKEVKSDMLEKDLFLDKFDTDQFALNFENSDIRDDLYFAELLYNIKMPMQFSRTAIEKVYTEGIIAEDKLEVEYVLLSAVALRDIINGNFKDTYIAEFTSTLLKKKQKLDSILSIIENQALQEKIRLNIYYSDYMENQKKVLEYTKKGYNFVITLDNSIKSIEDVERLKMFKIVIAPKNLVLYRELKSNRDILDNVIYK